MIAQYDTQSGFSYGGLFTFSFGPFALGLESMRNTRTWQVDTAAIGLGGRDKLHLGKIPATVGAGGFVTSDGSAGGYVDVGAVGAGLYGNALQRCP